MTLPSATSICIIHVIPPSSTSHLTAEETQEKIDHINNKYQTFINVVTKPSTKRKYIVIILEKSQKE